MRQELEHQHTILIVDDEPAIRKVIRGLVKLRLQARTIEAEDGEAALSMFQQHKPDLVITDIRMPGMGGVALLQEMKRRDSDVPVILVTGYPSIDVAIQGMKEGASDFLTKPFRLDEVQAVLEKALRERKLLLENQGLRREIHRKRAIEKLNEQLHRKVKELFAFYSLGETISSSPLNRNVILQAVLNLAKEVIHAQKIWFLVPEGGNGHTKTMMQSQEGADPIADGFLESERQYVMEQVLTQKKPVRHQGRRQFGDPMQVGNSHLAVPMMIQGEIYGVLHAFGKIKESGFDQQDLFFLSELTRRASLGLENNYLYESIFEVLMATLRSLVSTIEAKDPYTKQHSQRVTDLAVVIAKEMQCGPDQIDTLRVAGQLHDLGKLGVKDSILLKPGRLSKEEFDQIKTHPAIGESIIAPIGLLPDERALIRHHHERWDGKGYPDGLMGEQIPLLARILSVADAFDAMTSDRPYRAALSHRTGLDEIIRCKGTQFDPQVVEAFRSAFGRLQEWGSSKGRSVDTEANTIVARPMGAEG
jgi:response regulator RpfG family c-di-GMP phosphodiesterase